MVDRLLGQDVLESVLYLRHGPLLVDKAVILQVGQGLCQVDLLSDHLGQDPLPEQAPHHRPYL